MVVPLPPKGSRTVSFSKVYSFIRRSGIAYGNGAGCPFVNEIGISHTLHATCFTNSSDNLLLSVRFTRRLPEFWNISIYSCIIFKLKKHGYGFAFKNLVTPLCHSPCVPFGFTHIISFLNVKLRSSIIFWTSTLIALILLFDIAVPMLIQTNLPGSITLLTSLR